MTPEDLDRLAAWIGAHWPTPELTRLDRLALGRSLERARVTLREATAAVDLLIRSGERFQPRAPAILAAVREVRALQEGGPAPEPCSAVQETERRLLAAAEAAARTARPAPLPGPLSDLVRRALPEAS